MAEWFDNETFWMEMYSYLFPEERFAAAEEQIDEIFELVNFQGVTVLDLCCGPGRHSIALAKRGIQVTGVDRTAFFLERAKEKAQAEGVNIEWVLEDMRNFVHTYVIEEIDKDFTSVVEEESEVTFTHEDGNVIRLNFGTRTKGSA